MSKSTNTTDAIKDEATGVATRKVEHRGVEFEVPTDVNDWPARAVLDFEQERPMSAIRALVSPASFDKYLDTEPTVRDFGALAGLLTDAAGASGN